MTPGNGTDAPSDAVIERRLGWLAAAGLAATGLVLAALAIARVVHAPGGVKGVTSPLTWLLVAAALGAGLAARAGGAVRKVAAVVVATTLLALYTAEVVLELAPPDRARLVARRLHRRYDGRTRLQVVDSLRAAGFDAWPPVMQVNAWGLQDRAHTPPWPDSLPPLAGLPRVLTVMCNESGSYVTYQSDALGYNNMGAPDSPPAGGVAILGDSFVHGWCVPADSGLGPMMRRHWPDARSFGFGGFGPLLYLATLRDVVAPLRPRLVLWMHYEANDLTDIRRERADPRLAAYLDPAHHGRGQPPEPVLRAWMDSVVGRIRAERGPSPARRLLQLLPLTNVRQTWRDLTGTETRWGAPERIAQFPPVDSTDLEALLRGMRVARREVEGWGGRLVLVYLPSWERYFSPGALDARREDVLAVVRGAGVDLVDLEPVFTAAADTAGLFQRGKWMMGHYSSLGYRTVADHVAAALPRPGAVPATCVPAGVPCERR